MLRQEINLYPILGLEKPLVLPSWTHFWLTQLACFVLFLLITLFSVWHLHVLEKEIANLQQAKTMLEKQFLENKSHIPEAYFVETSENKAGAVSSTISKQENIVTALATNARFSVLLTLTAHLITPDVWFTDISFNQEGQKINLHGHSINAKSLQFFINALNTNPEIRNYKTTVNAIGSVSSKSPNNILDFELTMTKQSE